ncbi:MAG: phenylalanyl-tRNA synthetase beta chain, partial [Oceanicoccus sp.]
MKISLDWIQDFVKLPSDISPEEMSDLITKHTAEVEEIIDVAKTFEKMVLGKIKTLKKHPGADKLRLVQVDCGEKTHQIVCGGSNLKEDMQVAVALPGSVVQWHGNETVEMKEGNIRGEDSFGMICAGEEIGLAEMQAHQSDDSHAILDLNHIEAAAG